MNDFQFTKDRTLNLRDCDIAPGTIPYNIFKNAFFNYNRLILNDASINFDDFEDVREFWEKIGKSVNSVKYKGKWNSKMVICLTVFENLKILETSRADVLHGCSQMSINFLSKAFRNIEILHIDSIECNFENLFPNLKIIIYGTGNLKYKMRLTDERPYNNSISKEPLMNYTEGNNVVRHVEFIESEYRLQQYGSFKKLLEILESNQSIKINLILNYVPKEPIPDKINSLTLEKMNASILDEYLPNYNVKLKHLVLHNMYISYLDCLSTAIDYPNIEYLSIKLNHRSIDEAVIQCNSENSECFSLSQKFPRLKELNVDLKVLRKFCNFKTPMNHLRKLIITVEGCCMMSNINWSIMFPNLKYLRINLWLPFTEGISLTDIIMDIKDLLPNLTYLRIIPVNLNEDNEEEFKLLKYKALTYARNLKTLILGCSFKNCMNRVSFTTYLFDKLRHLKIIKLKSNGVFCLYRKF